MKSITVTGIDENKIEVFTNQITHISNCEYLKLTGENRGYIVVEAINIGTTKILVKESRQEILNLINGGN